MFKEHVALVVLSLVLCLAFRRTFAFYEETRLELKDEGASTTSKQINYWTEDENEEEVDGNISDETALEMKDESGHHLEDEEDADMEGMS